MLHLSCLAPHHWTCPPGAVRCPECGEQSRRIHSRAEWEALGLEWKGEQA